MKMQRNEEGRKRKERRSKSEMERKEIPLPMMLELEMGRVSELRTKKVGHVKAKGFWNVKTKQKQL